MNLVGVDSVIAFKRGDITKCDGIAIVCLFDSRSLECLPFALIAHLLNSGLLEIISRYGVGVGIFVLHYCNTGLLIDYNLEGLCLDLEGGILRRDLCGCALSVGEVCGRLAVQLYAAGAAAGFGRNDNVR